jgi:hypothetical protein
MNTFLILACFFAPSSAFCQNAGGPCVVLQNCAAPVTSPREASPLRPPVPVTDPRKR